MVKCCLDCKHIDFDTDCNEDEVVTCLCGYEIEFAYTQPKNCKGFESAWH